MLNVTNYYLCLVNQTWRKEGAKALGDISYGKTIQEKYKTTIKKKPTCSSLKFSFAIEDNIQL